MFLIALALMGIFFMLFYPSFSYTYRITIEVETPEGIKTGSSVIQVFTKQHTEIGQNYSRLDCRYNSKALGEAVVVDLGERGILFAPLMDSPYGVRIFPFTFTGQGCKGYAKTGIPEYAKVKDFKATVPKGHYPTFVHFKDINDIATMKKVGMNELANFFGEGVKIKDIIVESTTDPIEWKIEKILKWYNEEESKIPKFSTIRSFKVSEKTFHGFSYNDYPGSKYFYLD